MENRFFLGQRPLQFRTTVTRRSPPPASDILHQLLARAKHETKNLVLQSIQFRLQANDFFTQTGFCILSLITVPPRFINFLSQASHIRIKLTLENVF